MDSDNAVFTFWASARRVQIKIPLSFRGRGIVYVSTDRSAGMSLFGDFYNAKRMCDTKLRFLETS